MKPSRDRKRDQVEDIDDHRLEAISCIFLAVWISADVSDLYEHKTLALCLYFVALSLPLYLFGEHFSKGWNKWKIFGKWIFIISLPILLLGIYAVSRLTSFSCEIEGGMWCEPFSRNSNPGIWCIHTRPPSQKNPFEEEASPVYALLYVKFVNERDVPMFVHGFSIETKNKAGLWERMPIIDVFGIDTTPVEFYSVDRDSPFETTGKKACKIDFKENFLEFKFADRSLIPHEPVFGWVMLDIPKDGEVDVNNMRFSINTGAEIISQKITSYVVSEHKMDINIERGSYWFGIGPVSRDITSLPAKFYGDGASCTNL